MASHLLLVLFFLSAAFRNVQAQDCSLEQRDYLRTCTDRELELCAFNLGKSCPVGLAALSVSEVVAAARMRCCHRKPRTDRARCLQSEIGRYRRVPRIFFLAVRRELEELKKEDC